MNTSNIILLIIGIFILVLGVVWSNKDSSNILMKLLLLAGGAYVSLYSLYLSDVVIILNKR